MAKVLLLASGISAKQYHEYDYKENGWTIVAVNNGWITCPNDWDYWIRSNDYKGNIPESFLNHQKIATPYGPSLKEFGGHLACGYSIVLAGGYWSLDKLRPTTLGILGGDMNYKPDEKGNTHIYGLGYDIQKRGISDPDFMASRYGGNDPNYLENIYNRFARIAQRNKCKVFNLSHTIETRLPYERKTPSQL